MAKMGRPTVADTIVSANAESINHDCCKVLDEILIDLADGTLDMATAALAAKVGLVNVRLRDVLRTGEASGIAKTRPMT